MSLIKLSDMTGCCTLLDWSKGLSIGSFRTFQPKISMLPEEDRAALVYLFSNKVSPFSIFCIKYSDVFYIVSGQNELFTMHQFMNGKCGISKLCWFFHDEFPSKTSLCYWNDIPMKEHILSTYIPAQYITLDNACDFYALRDFFRKREYP